jgi:hypothetical protein
MWLFYCTNYEMGEYANYEFTNYADRNSRFRYG